MKCCRCNRGIGEIGGYLRRVNPKGEVPAVWECAPNCSADLPQETNLLLAIEDDATPANEGKGS